MLELSFSSINDESKPSAAKESVEQQLQTKQRYFFLRVKNNFILHDWRRKNKRMRAVFQTAEIAGAIWYTLRLSAYILFY